MESETSYFVNPREMYPGKTMYEVCSLTGKALTIYAICHTQEKADKELEQVKAGTHSTQVLPGGTL